MVNSQTINYKFIHQERTLIAGNIRRKVSTGL